MVHEEAEGVARGVDPRDEVVHALGRAEERGAGWVAGVGGAELVEDGVRVDGGRAGGVEDVGVDEAPSYAFSRSGELAVGPPEGGEVVTEVGSCKGGRVVVSDGTVEGYLDQTSYVSGRGCSRAPP